MNIYHPDFSKVKSTKRKRLDILWELLDICKDIGVGVEFKPKEEQTGEELDGAFDCTCLHIDIFKSKKEKDISLHTLWVLAHEIRHAQQFIERLKPNAWLFFMGVFEKSPRRDVNWLEADADRWACDFMRKYIQY